MSVVVFPSRNNWITPRVNEIQITSKNCKIITNTKIEKIEKILVNGAMAQVNLKGKFPASGGSPATNRVCKFSDLYTTKTGENRLSELDITRFVVDAKEYAALSIWDKNSTLVASTKNTRTILTIMNTVAMRYFYLILTIKEIFRSQEV